MDIKRVAADWWPISVLLALGAAAVLDETGQLLPIWRWLVEHRPPDFWSALAAWVAVLVGIVTVIVAGRYARQQVEKAQDQVREAQAARVAQADQARDALETQVRIAEEQAQPNVVLFTELNPSAKQFIEIVVKNFGTTPAYHVKAAFDPPLKATPNLISKGHLADVPIPDFPILAPGQEWRTGWDHSISRKQHLKKWAPLAGKTESELSEEQKLTIQAHMSYTGETYTYEQVIEDMTLPPVHTATVTYEDSQGKPFETKAVLDSELFKGTTWVDIKTMHDLVKTVEKQQKEQNKGLEAIHRRLAEFGTEHEGIWIYGSDDDEERRYRQAILEAKALENRESHSHIEWQLSGRHGDDPWTRPNPGDAVRTPVEQASIGDWCIPGDDDTFQLAQAWRIAFIKSHTNEDSGVVIELFDSDGDSVREREGTPIWIIRKAS